MDSKKSEGMKIRILPEGPYEVVGGVPLNQAIIVPFYIQPSLSSLHPPMSSGM